MNSNQIRTYVVGGFIVFLFIFALYSQTFYRRPPAAPRTFALDQEVDVNITLISPDAKQLACQSAEELKGYHCEFQGQNVRWNKQSTTGRAVALDTLAPYKTTDDYLFLVPGLFSQDALRERLTFDPPNSSAEHIRFVANCKMHIVGKLGQVDVRWATTGAWQGQRDVWVGSVSACWLSDG